MTPSFKEIPSNKIESDIPWDEIVETNVYGPVLSLVGGDAHQEWLRAIHNPATNDILSYREIDADISGAVPVQIKEVVLSNGMRWVKPVGLGGEVVNLGYMIHTVDDCPCGKEHQYAKIDSIDSPAVLQCGMDIDMMYQSDDGFHKSVVNKTIQTASGTYLFEMFAQPTTQGASLMNEFRVNDKTRLWVKAYNDWDDKHDCTYPTLSVNMSIQNESSNVDMTFNPDGSFRFAEIYIQGPIIRTYTQKFADGTATFTERGRATRATIYADRVDNPTLRRLMKEVFGITYGDSLQIDTKTTGDNLIKNMLTDEPRMPHQCIAFKEVEHVVNTPDNNRKPTELI